MKQRILTSPDNTANLQTPLPDGVLVPLQFPITEVNTMTAGKLEGNTFTALIDGLFRFNVSTQAEIVDHYELEILHYAGEVSYKDVGWAKRNSEGQADGRISLSKDVTFKMKAGDTAVLSDAQYGSTNGARRWAYSDTNRIEISLED